MSLAHRRSYTFDAALQLKDAGLVASSAAAQVSSAAQVLDVGASPFMGVAVIDATAIEIDSSNEVFTIIIQGSNSSTFAGTAAVDLAAIRLGHATGLATGESSTPTAGGRWELPFINDQNDVVYRYIRAYILVAGTIATGINCKIFVGRPPGGF